MIFDKFVVRLGSLRWQGKPPTDDQQPTTAILSVILPRGFHPFPSRTRKLSPAGPIVLCAKVYGRVGRRRIKLKGHVLQMSVAFWL